MAGGALAGGALAGAYSTAVGEAARFFSGAPPATPPPEEPSLIHESTTAADDSALSTPHLWRSTQTKCFVGNLSWDTTEDDLIGYIQDVLPVESVEGGLFPLFLPSKPTFLHVLSLIPFFIIHHRLKWRPTRTLAGAKAGLL